MAGYWIVRGSAVKDQQAFERYVELWKPIGAKYGAVVLAGRGEHQCREGASCERVLLIQFPSYEQAVACYDDPDYQVALEYAHRAADRDLIIVAGM